MRSKVSSCLRFYVFVCLSVCLFIWKQLKLREIFYWEVHQKCAEKNEFGENRAKKYPSRGDLRPSMTALITNVPVPVAARSKA